MRNGISICIRIRTRIGIGVRSRIKIRVGAWDEERRYRELGKAMKKGMSAEDIPGQEALSSPKMNSGNLAPVCIITFRNWEARNQAVPLLSNVTGIGARVCFGPSTDRFNRFLIAGA